MKGAKGSDASNCYKLHFLFPISFGVARLEGLVPLVDNFENVLIPASAAIAALSIRAICQAIHFVHIGGHGRNAKAVFFCKGNGGRALDHRARNADGKIFGKRLATCKIFLDNRVFAGGEPKHASGATPRNGDDIFKMPTALNIPTVKKTEKFHVPLLNKIHKGVNPQGQAQSSEPPMQSIFYGGERIPPLLRVAFRANRTLDFPHETASYAKFSGDGIRKTGHFRGF
jgi:hypothetical protein